jgi:hypothetical protein
MLWCAMDEEAGKAFMPQGMRDRITQAYLLTHPNIQQPVQKVSLNIYTIQDTLMIDKVPELIGNGGGFAVPAAPAGAPAQTFSLNQFRTANNNIRAFGGTIQGGFARQDPQQAAMR